MGTDALPLDTIRAFLQRVTRLALYIGRSTAKGNIRIFVSAEKKTAHRLYSKDLLLLHDYR